MKLNQIINLHKGLTAFVVIGLMIFFDLPEGICNSSIPTKLTFTFTSLK